MVDDPVHIAPPISGRVNPEAMQCTKSIVAKPTLQFSGRMLARIDQQLPEYIVGPEGTRSWADPKSR